MYSVRLMGGNGFFFELSGPRNKDPAENTTEIRVSHLM